jgi:biopolymer transport protein ExbD
MKGLQLGLVKKSAPPDINMAPMIDMTFLLLIFFLVTTSFVKESGVEVKRPIASTTVDQEKTNMVVGVTEEGYIYIEGQLVDIRSLRSRMERFQRENPLGNVVITADKNSQFGTSIEVLDKVREAGITNVVVAASKE